jgi:acetylornithine deacetylase/succinyl-diaminopimelate desuccinylase-like protein
MILRLALAILFVTLQLNCRLYASSSPENATILYENNAYNIQEILSKYIQIESLSGEESKAGEFLRKICVENGLYITQMGESDGNYNFTASIVPLDKNLPNIVFLNHLDVIPAGDLDQWQYPPFSGEVTETEIWGRGAFDNKGTAIMQLFSIIEIAKRYKQQHLPYNVTFLPVSCEETQCEGGIKFVVENYLEIINPAVVIGEGPPAIQGLIENQPELALFGISVAQKRALWLQLKLELKTIGHSSVTPAAYANKEMVIALNNLLEKKSKIKYNSLNVDLLKQFGHLNKGLKGFVLKHPRFFKPLITPKLRKDPVLLALFSNTITLTNLSDGNDKINVISDKVTAILDCRLLPNESTEKFIKYIKRSLNNKNISIEIIQEMKPVPPSSDDTMFFNNLKKAIELEHDNSKSVAVLLPNANDTSFFREHGIPAYSSVPVKIERKYLEYIHNHNERIPKDILTKGMNTYVSFVELCLN